MEYTVWESRLNKNETFARITWSNISYWSGGINELH